MKYPEYVPDDIRNLISSCVVHNLPNLQPLLLLFYSHYTGPPALASAPR